MLKFSLVEIDAYFPIRFFLCTETEMLFIQKGKMTKVKVKNNVFYYELSSKPNVDIIVITVYLWKQHNLETIFTSNNVMNIQYAIVKGYGSQYR